MRGKVEEPREKTSDGCLLVFTRLFPLSFLSIAALELRAETPLTCSRPQSRLDAFTRKGLSSTQDLEGLSSNQDLKSLSFSAL